MIHQSQLLWVSVKKSERKYKTKKNCQVLCYVSRSGTIWSHKYVIGNKNHLYQSHHHFSIVIQCANKWLRQEEFLVDIMWFGTFCQDLVFLFNLGVFSDDLREWIFTLLFVLSLTRNQEIDVERSLSRQKQAKKRISNDYRLMIDDGTYEKNQLARYRYQI